MQSDKLNGSHNNPIVGNKSSWLFDRLNQRITDNDEAEPIAQIQVKIERLTKQNVLSVTRLITHFSWNGQSFQMP